METIRKGEQSRFRIGNRDCHENNTINSLGWGDDRRDRIDRAGGGLEVGCGVG